MTSSSANEWITTLNLEPHPEGGFYKRTFASDDYTALDDDRLLYTSIYFLLRSGEISHFHRLQSDELWYFHAGSSLHIHMIDKQGKYTIKKLGLNPDLAEVPQVLVPKNTIFGSSVEAGGDYGLAGCMVSPGFDFADFKLFTQQELLAHYPEHREIIRKLAYETIDGA